MATEWVPAREAMRRLGISAQALKGRRRRGTIEIRPSSLDDGGYLYKVPGSSAASIVTPDEWEALRELLPSSRPEEAEPETRQDGGPYRILSLFDVHTPDADAFAVKAVLDFAAEHRPDHVVIGGDFLELESCSQHGGNPSPLALVDEIKSGRKLLDRIRKACPGAALTYLEGNHETRLHRVVAANLPTFDGAIDLPNLLSLADYDCEWVPYRKLWQPSLAGGVKGKLFYTHGEWAVQHHAAKHLLAYGVSVRYGHTHKPQAFTRGYGDGRVGMAIGTGCLRTLAPSWAGPNNGWLHGFGWDEFWPDGNFTAYNIVLVNRSFSFAGKQYGVVNK